MRLILHIGQFKTGTSALQQFLRGSEDALREQGVLYPANKFAANDHSFLYPLIFSREPLPRYENFRFRGDRRKASRSARSAWLNVLQQISEVDPETVILSTEYLFKHLNSYAAKNLVGLLQERSFESRVCVYLREPAAGYLSLVQQILKYSASFPAPRPTPCREILETYSSVPGLSVIGCAYDRSLMHGSDICTDFIKRFLPDELRMDSLTRSIQDNTSMSAEAMAVNQEFRARTCSGQDNVVKDYHSLFLAALREADVTVPGFRRPQLRAEVQELVNRQADEFLWLRDEFGLVFPDLPYKKIGQQCEVKPENYRNVSDICEVNADRAARLLYEAMTKVDSLAGRLRRLRLLIRNSLFNRRLP